MIVINLQYYVMIRFLLTYFYLYESKIWNNPYREAVILKFTLIWNSEKIEDQAKIFTEFHFWMSYINKIKSYDYPNFILHMLKREI